MFSGIFNEVLSLRPRFTQDLAKSEEYLGSFILDDKIARIVNKFLTNSGKRIRSILYFKFFYRSKTCLVDIKKKYKTIAAVEALHAASIIHDDVVDYCDTRRGGESFLKAHGIKKSVLMGDYLIISIIKDFFKLHEEEVIRRMFLRECHATAYGAALEQELTVSSTLQDYIRVASLKTSSLFKLSCLLGAYLATGDFEEAKKAAIYGICFGILFQVQNDLDCYKFKKFEESEDYVQKNITLPIVILRDYCGYNIGEFHSSSQKEYENIQDMIKSEIFRKKTENVMKKYLDVLSRQI